MTAPRGWWIKFSGLHSPLTLFPFFISWSRFTLHSFSDIVNSKLGMPRPQIGQSISQQGFFSSRDSLSVPCVSQPLHSYSATTSDMDLSRKNESKSSSKLKPGEQPLLGSWNPSTVAPRESIAHPTATSASTNHLTSNNGNGVNNNNADRWVEPLFPLYNIKSQRCCRRRRLQWDEYFFFILLLKAIRKRKAIWHNFPSSSRRFLQLLMKFSNSSRSLQI